jgi:hypothetical protein
VPSSALRPHGTWGYGEATGVDVYDADTDRWMAGHLAEPRILIAPAILGSEVLLAGGKSRRPQTVSRMLRQPWLTSLTQLRVRGLRITSPLVAPARRLRTLDLESHSLVVTWTAPAVEYQRPSLSTFSAIRTNLRSVAQGRPSRWLNPEEQWHITFQRRDEIH